MSNLGNVGYKVVDIYMLPINYSQKLYFVQLEFS